jgi:RNA polymerase sigma-70 factor (ECF subfamily)
MSPLIINGRTEIELLKGCLSGDRKSQEAVFNIYAPRMMSVCLRYARHRQEAEDILQDGFVKMFTSLHQYEGQGSFEGWIRRIMINTALRYIQKMSRSHEDIGIEYLPEESLGPDIFERLSEEELLNLIAMLPDGYRIVFNLFAIEGYSHKEISDILNIEEATSRSQLSKARRILQAKVVELYHYAI